MFFLPLPAYFLLNTSVSTLLNLFNLFQSTPVKRQNSDVGTSGRNSSTSDAIPSTSKRVRLTGSRSEENGISDVGTELLNMPVVMSEPVRKFFYCIIFLLFVICSNITSLCFVVILQYLFIDIIL